MEAFFSPKTTPKGVGNLAEVPSNGGLTLIFPQKINFYLSHCYSPSSLIGCR